MFDQLAKSTQSEYRRIMLEIAQKIGREDVREITRPEVIAIRDKVAKTSTRKADRVVTALSILIEHAIDRGFVSTNASRGVWRVNQTEETEPWPEWALRGFRDHAIGGSRSIFELALGTGQRLSDVCRIRWADYDGEAISLTQAQTKEHLWVPTTPALKEYLTGLPRTADPIAWQSTKGPTRGTWPRST